MEISGWIGCGYRHANRAATQKISLPNARSAVVFISIIADCGKIKRAVCRHRVDSLRENSVLKWRFVIIALVVNYDATTIAAQVKNILRETGFAAVGRGKIKLRSRREVVDDFQHRRSFAAAGNAALSRQNRDVGRQISRRLRVAQIIHAVGQHADFYARAVHDKVGARNVGTVRSVALRFDASPHSGLCRALDEIHIRQTGERFERIQRHERADGMKPRNTRGDRAACLLDLFQQIIRDTHVNVHQHPAIRFELDARLKICRD